MRLINQIRSTVDADIASFLARKLDVLGAAEHIDRHGGDNRLPAMFTQVIGTYSG